MFFRKKDRQGIKCDRCDSTVEEAYNFCPHCGNEMLDPEEDMKNFGMLGKDDIVGSAIKEDMIANNLGITDKLIGSLVNSLVKNLDKQFKDLEKTEMKNFPAGIKIKIGGMPLQQIKEPRTTRKTVTDEQIRKMTDFPRINARAIIRRLSDKVVYELKTPGLESPQDVFISKSESGFE